MKIEEIRDLAVARNYLIQSIHFQRASTAEPHTLPLLFKAALELASTGEPLPPIGFIGDVIHVMLGTNRNISKDHAPVAGWLNHQSRAYEDYVVGKLNADWTIERAADALRQYSKDERPRGIAFTVQHIANQIHFGGTLLSPAVIRELQSLPAADVLNQGIESLIANGPDRLIVDQLNDLVVAFRRSSELLTLEDITALEQRMALADYGQYLAHRRIERTAKLIQTWLDEQPIRPRPGRAEVPTHATEEDVYPVGGYSSIGTKGTIESLLHSQLAYLEDGPNPDLFSVKFVRDELFYYTRDENQFLRRKRAFVIILDPSLMTARVKDPDAPEQRIVLVLAGLVALIRKLIDWLTTDELKIEFLIVAKEQPEPLKDEAELLKIFFRDAFERGTVAIQTCSETHLLERMDGLSRTHQLQIITITATPTPRFEASTQILISNSRPIWTNNTNDQTNWHDDDPISAWSEAMLAVLREWV